MASLVTKDAKLLDFVTHEVEEDILHAKQKLYNIMTEAGPGRYCPPCAILPNMHVSIVPFYPLSTSLCCHTTQLPRHHTRFERSFVEFYGIL